MGDNNEEVSLTDFVVAQPTAADQNDLIMQLMQQIAEMRVEMQRMQDLSNRVSSFNPPRDGRPPLHYPPSSTEQVQNLLSNPIQNPPTIDLTTLYPHHATTSCQAPHRSHNTNQILHLPRNQNNDPQNFLQNYQANQIPRIPPLSHSYLKRLLSKSQLQMNLMPIVPSLITVRNRRESGGQKKRYPRRKKRSGKP